VSVNCPTCGGTKNRRSRQCRSCSNRALRETSGLPEPTIVCPDCGGYKGNPYAVRCYECAIPASRGGKSWVCPGCGGRKMLNSRLCAKCNGMSIRGENHPQWKPGITQEERELDRKCDPEYASWRKAVFARDDYTCQLCDKRGGYLHAHHIERWAENPARRLDVDNGITFCEKHHRWMHSKLKAA